MGGVEGDGADSAGVSGELGGEKRLLSPLLGDGHVGDAGGDASGDGFVGVGFLEDAAGEVASEAGLGEGEGQGGGDEEGGGEDGGVQEDGMAEGLEETVPLGGRRGVEFRGDGGGGWGFGGRDGGYGGGGGSGFVLRLGGRGGGGGGALSGR